METTLVKIDPKEYGLDESKVANIEAAFMPKIVERDALKEIYSRIITSEITKELCNEAGDIRRKLVKVRTGIADIHKTQKAYFLAAGRFVDAWKNKETEPIEQMEESLSQIEKHYEKIAAEKVAKLKKEREEKLSTVCDTPDMFHCELLSDDAFERLFSGLKVAKENKEAEERKAEADRIAREKAEAEERDRIRLENIRLKAKEEAEKKVIKDREEAEKKAAKAPDKAKLIEFADRLMAAKLPEMKTIEGKKVMEAIADQLKDIAAFAHSKANIL